MGQAFIVMQIGNQELDKVYQQVIDPSVRGLGLEPKRIDKHNEGGLLKSKITAFIEGSDIIVADLTNERPNCYLEVGYTMGLNKFQNLILTAREDHNPDSPNYRSGRPKVHFDLSGYDILFWDPNDLDAFRAELKKRIERRLKAVSSPNRNLLGERTQVSRRPELIFVDEMTGNHRSLYVKNVGVGSAINIVRNIINPGDLTKTTPNEPLPLKPLAPMEQVYAYCATHPPNDSVPITDDPKFCAVLEYDDILGNHYQTAYEKRRHAITRVSKRQLPVDQASRI